LTSILYEGAPVRVNPRSPGHFSGQNGVVLTMPVHPVTWFRVRFPCGTVSTFRSSNLIPLDPETGETLSRRPHVPRDSCSSLDTMVTDSEPRRRDTTATAPLNIIKQPAVPKKRLPQASASFDDAGACRNCGTMRWMGIDRFCWNENCSHSPIYFKLPGCRGVTISNVVPSVSVPCDEDDFERMDLDEDGHEDSEDLLSLHQVHFGGSKSKKVCNRVRSRSDSISTDTESVTSSSNAATPATGDKTTLGVSA
jgi:hypothetical protein